MRNLTIEDAVSSVKYMIEKAIRDGGVEGKITLSEPSNLSVCCMMLPKVHLFA